MVASVIADAHWAFRQGRYHTARNIYLDASEQYGSHLFKANFALCERRERKKILSVNYSVRPPWVTYCVPCFLRQKDLEKNLSHNLKVLSRFDRVRLILNLFDPDDFSHQWVKHHFSAELASGLLQVNCEPALTEWFAPVAKNSFAKYLEADISGGSYYAALDSDNRLTESDVIRTRQAIEEFGPCIIHHFQGDWGDGTCGRLTMPAKVYRENLCAENLLPRQGEEIALLINAVKAHPDWPVITRHGVNVFAKSNALKLLTSLNRWDIQNIPCDLGDAPVAYDATDSHYVRNNPKLAVYARLNGYYTCFLASTYPQARAEFQHLLRNVQQELASAPLLSEIADKILEPYPGQRMCEKDRRCPQIAVIQSWDEQMREWLEKQRQRGIRRFLLVNATGNENLRQQLNDPGVTLFKPLLGDAETFKDLWMATLTRLYGEPTDTLDEGWPTAAIQ